MVFFFFRFYLVLSVPENLKAQVLRVQQFHKLKTSITREPQVQSLLPWISFINSLTLFNVKNNNRAIVASTNLHQQQKKIITVINKKVNLLYVFYLYGFQSCNVCFAKSA